MKKTFPIKKKFRDVQQEREGAISYQVFLKSNKTSFNNFSGYLKLSRAISGYLGLYRAISGYLRLSQAISGYLGLSLAISDYFGLTRTTSDYF